MEHARGFCTTEGKDIKIHREQLESLLQCKFKEGAIPGISSSSPPLEPLISAAEYLNNEEEKVETKPQFPEKES